MEALKLLLIIKMYKRSTDCQTIYKRKEIHNIVSDSCLTLMSNFSTISWWKQRSFEMSWWWFLFYTRLTLLFDFDRASSLKQQSRGRHVTQLWHIISNSKAISLYSYSLMQLAYFRSRKYQFYSFGFTQIYCTRVHTRAWKPIVNR